MNLFDKFQQNGFRQTRVGDLYEVTRKPRGLDLSNFQAIPFAPMDGIPAGGEFQPQYSEKKPNEITSGTYFERGDILVAKITPSFENGKQAIAEDLPNSFGYATTEVIPLRPRIPGQDRRLLFFYLLHPEVRSHVAGKMQGSTGRQRVPEDVLLELPYPEIEGRDQTAMANALALIRRAIRVKQRLVENSVELKRAALRELFARGLSRHGTNRNGQGGAPSDWNFDRLDQHASVVSTRMSYSELEASSNNGSTGSLKVLGIRVSDMNAPGNEVTLIRAALQRHMPRPVVEHRCAPPRTIVFPKRGAAIATNKKRITDHWSAFDPNIIGIIAHSVDQRFLFHWFQNFDLRTITEPGPTPQLNKKNLEPLLIPIPPTRDEQREMADIFDAIDNKIHLHKQQTTILTELFHSLLHKLVTGEIAVTDLNLSVFESSSVAPGALA